MDDAVDVNALILKTNDLKVCIYTALNSFSFQMSYQLSTSMQCNTKQKGHGNNGNYQHSRAVSKKNLNLGMV